MRAFIEANFKMMDVNSDGVIGLEEFRYNCIQRLATDDVKVVDDAFNQLLNVSQNRIKFFSIASPSIEKVFALRPRKFRSEVFDCTLKGTKSLAYK